MITIYSGIFSKEFNLERFKNDAWNFASFDDDANGNNGDEFLLPEAKEAGFKNNIEYWATLAYKRNSTIEDAIAAFLDLLGNSWDNSCDGWNIQQSELVDGFIFTVFAYYYDRY